MYIKYTSVLTKGSSFKIRNYVKKRAQQISQGTGKVIAENAKYKSLLNSQTFILRTRDTASVQPINSH